MEYCTIQEAAKILNLSRPTVYKMIEDGDLDRYLLLGRPALKLSQVNKLRDKLAKQNGKPKSRKES